MKLSIRKLSISLTLLSVVGVKTVPSFVSSLQPTQKSSRDQEHWYEEREGTYPKTDGTLINLPSANDLYGMSTRNLPSKIDPYKKFGGFTLPGNGIFVLFPPSTLPSTSLRHCRESVEFAHPIRSTSAS